MHAYPFSGQHSSTTHPATGYVPAYNAYCFMLSCTYVPSKAGKKNFMNYASTYLGLSIATLHSMSLKALASSSNISTLLFISLYYILF